MALKIEGTPPLFPLIIQEPPVNPFSNLTSDIIHSIFQHLNEVCLNSVKTTCKHLNFEGLKFHYYSYNTCRNNLLTVSSPILLTPSLSPNKPKRSFGNALGKLPSREIKAVKARAQEDKYPPAIVALIHAAKIEKRLQEYGIKSPKNSGKTTPESWTPNYTTPECKKQSPMSAIAKEICQIGDLCKAVAFWKKLPEEEQTKSLLIKLQEKIENKRPISEALTLNEELPNCRSLRHKLLIKAICENHLPTADNHAEMLSPTEKSHAYFVICNQLIKSDHLQEAYDRLTKIAIEKLQMTIRSRIYSSSISKRDIAMAKKVS